MCVLRFSTCQHKSAGLTMLQTEIIANYLKLYKNNVQIKQFSSTQERYSDKKKKKNLKKYFVKGRISPTVFPYLTTTPLRISFKSF